MMKRWMAGLAVAFLCTAAPAMAQQSAADAAASMQSLVGSEYEGDLQVTAVTSEGNTLVISFNGRSGWEGMSPQDINAAFLHGFCGNPNAIAFFKAGNSVRIDTLDHGASKKQGIPVSACPAQ